jgi:hypothetical protein
VGPNAMAPQSLPAALASLCRLLIQELEKHGPQVREEVYLKNVVTEFRYDKQVVNRQSRMQPVVRSEWDLGDKVRFTEQRVKPAPEYQRCLKLIVERGTNGLEEADSWLFRFVQKAADQLRDQTDEGVIVDMVSTFMADLDGGPIDWEVKAPLDGVWLADEKIQLASDYILRRPTAADFETEVRYGLPEIHMPGLDMYSAVLEFHLRTRQPFEVQREVEVVLDLLRLFRLGSVVARNAAMKPKSYLQFGGTFGYQLTQLVASYRYGLGHQDTQALDLLVKKLKAVITEYSTYAVPAIAGDALSIAFQRFKEALFLAGANEARITSAITCLEALFLKAEERAELAHRLGQRVGALLAFAGVKPIEAYTKVAQAYDIRSAFIHGSPIAPDHQKSAPGLCESVLNYARLALLFMFQFRAKQGAEFDKEKLLRRIDNSLLDGGARAALRESISESVSFPAIAQPQ